MRMVVINQENFPGFDYPMFGHIRKKILDTTPFGLINDIFDSDPDVGNRAFFFFVDRDYIPEELEKFIIRPPKGGIDEDVHYNTKMSLYKAIERRDKRIRELEEELGELKAVVDP